MKEQLVLPTPDEERRIAEGIAADPDAAPDLSLRQEGVVRRPDLSRSSATEVLEIRLDKDVISFFRAEGPGWQRRINAALRKAAGL